jgi:hypothetical protein
MKVVITEEQYQQILKEDLGVSRATIPFINIVLNEVTPIVEDMTFNKKNDLETINLDYNTMKQVVKSEPDSFIEFPVEGLDIEIKFGYVKKPNGNAKFRTGGAMYQIKKESQGESYMKLPSLEIPEKILKEINKTIIGKMEVEVLITPTFEPVDINDLIDDLRDSITHEMLHLYEFYKRWESTGKGEIDLTKTFAGGINPNVPKKIFAYYSSFLDLVYYSEPYELNAMSQEAYSKSFKMTPEDFTKSPYWIAADKMEKFNADQFFDGLVDVIKQRSGEDTLVYHLSNLHKFYMKQYRQIAKQNNKPVPQNIEKTNSIYDLFKMYEPRINKAGKKLKRNLGRVYGIEKS